MENARRPTVCSRHNSILSAARHIPSLQHLQDEMEPLMSAVDLAEKYEYPALVKAVQLRPVLAREVDDFGMTPLHWICSDPKVPLRVLQKLVLVHPPATATKNLAGLLPLHIALRKNLPLEALKLLLKFYPKAIAVATPDGRSPLDLANEHVSVPSTRLFLQMLDAEVRALSRVTMASKKTQKQQQLRDAAVATTPLVFVEPRSNSKTRNQRKMDRRSPANAAAGNGGVDTEPQKQQPAPQMHTRQHMKENAYNSNNQLATKEPNNSSNNVSIKTDMLAVPVSPGAASYRDPIADLLSSPSMRAARVQQHPPVWKLDKRCHICECKFGYFKSRHHCRNCGESVCGRHSRDSLPLRHIGLFDPQRVCAVCHEHLQNTLVGCNTNENNSSSHYQYNSRDSIVSSSCCTPSSVTRPGVNNMNNNATCSSESSNNYNQSLFWSPEALSPRLFSVPPPPKRTKSVRDYLLLSPPAAASVTTTRNRNRTLDAGTSSPLVLSPTARSVRSESLRCNYSYATLSSLPMFPSSSSMFLSRVQLAPAPSQLLKVPEKQKRKPKSRKDENGEHQATSSSSSRSRRRLAKTELDMPSKAWYEELDQVPAQTSQKLSMDSRVSELEEHVQKLLTAKKQIGEALKKSQLQIHMARAKKDKYDAIAQKYLDEGYAPCSPHASSSTRGNSDPAMELVSHEENDDQQQVVGSSYASSPTDNQRQHDVQENDREGGADNNNEDVRERLTASEENLSSCCGVRPSSPLPAPRLSPFKSEKLELHIPLDVAVTHHELGVILLGKCDFASAAAEFQKSLDINGDNAIAWYHLAKALDGAGDQEAAERAVNKSLALESDSLPSLSLLGRLLHLRGEHDEAIVVFRQALNLQCPAVGDGGY